MIEELERLARRALALPLAAPLLLFGGWGLGKATVRVIALPEDPATRIEASVPRIQIEALGGYMEGLRQEGQRTADYVSLYRDHVAPLESVLRRRGVPRGVARQVAWPLVYETHRRRLDPATVVSVLLIESEGKPRATSPVGARGLMQVMPAWAGNWGCGRDLYDIEDNLCTGVSILRWYIDQHEGDQRRALLGYNGCVRGRFTRDCFRYPEKVERLSRQIRGELAAARRRTEVAGGAAAP